MHQAWRKNAFHRTEETLSTQATNHWAPADHHNLLDLVPRCANSLVTNCSRINHQTVNASTYLTAPNHRYPRRTTTSVTSTDNGTCLVSPRSQKAMPRTVARSRLKLRVSASHLENCDDHCTSEVKEVQCMVVDSVRWHS